jgi:hypothetical protein
LRSKEIRFGGRRFRTRDAEISMKRFVRWKNKEQWQRIRTYMDNYKDM